MIEFASEEIAAIFKRAEKEPLIAERPRATLFDRSWIMERLPHRDPFLLLDRVHSFDVERGLVAASYDLSRAAEVLAGHFPSQPIYPGLLQIEAIGQAGILAGLEQQGLKVDGVKLTHVLGARFLRPVGEKGTLEIVTQTLEDGFFMTIVGQSIYEGEICSVAAVTGLT